MSQENQKTNTDLDEIDKDINYHRIMIGLIIVAVIAFYLIMKEVQVTPNAQLWGTVGDFFGGILNPIFALFAFYWLTYSVRLQIKELKETRIELGKAAKAQEASAEHQEQIARLESEILELNKDTLKSQQDGAIAQQQQVAIQNFESLFFQLLKTKTDVTNDILVGAKGTLIKFAKYDIEKSGPLNEKDSINKIHEMIENRVEGKESIKDHIILFKSHVVESWENFYTEAFLDYAGSYFRVSYQIVKLIDQNDSLQNLKEIDENKYSEKQKEYFDIFRATFSQYELEAFFFNCLSKYGNKSFKKLLEKYGMFEPLLIDNKRSYEIYNSLTRYAYQYDKIIFEENELWGKYFKVIDFLKLVDVENIKKEFYILLKNDFLFFDEKYVGYRFNKSDFKNKYWDKFLNHLICNKKYDNPGFDFRGFPIQYYFQERIITKVKSLEEKNMSLRIYYNEACKLESSSPNEISRTKEQMESNDKIISELKNVKNLDIIFLFLEYRIRPEEFFQYFKLK
ncbi:putative phage abortive infection protein [Acinetobacter sp. TGL-Y2]|uniref:putative phage abortive infection protein n=1 Tax=Acinetobacter sp. TGL-Y2 TaxID=1407071 RepID=UPI0019077585|nr:putative phage abortive infection protein [Acinetobacter sp. TGL-Y2]MBJ9370548.1 putative phage abortive infection protein [Acinetobacter sp. TGL-Y2]